MRLNSLINKFKSPVVISSLIGGVGAAKLMGEIIHQLLHMSAPEPYLDNSLCPFTTHSQVSGIHSQ